MNHDIAIQWCERLKSGDYAQTQGDLNFPGKGFCCLGVLSDMYLRAHPEHTPWEPDYSGRLCFVSYLDEERGDSGEKQYFSSSLSEEVKRWSGVRSGLGYAVGDLRNDLCLSALNDNNKTFAEIADVIEANWEKY